MDFSNQKQSRKQKFVAFLKNNYAAIIIGFVVFALFLSAIIVAITAGDKPKVVVPDNTEEVAAVKIDWGYPVEKVEILKPYSDSELQYNSTFNRWEAHKAIDFKASETDQIKSVLDGTVVSVTKDLLNGNVVVIEHSGGLKTTYGSLSDDIKVKTGDKVKKGTVLGFGGTSSSKESAMGSHLHFEVSLNGKRIDPAKYIKIG